MDWGAVFGAAALIPLLNASVRLAVPTGLAAVGESLCQKAGVLNLSLEGMMLTGAYAAFLGAHYSGEPWVGVLTGIVGGVLIGVLMARFSVTRAGKAKRVYRRPASCTSDRSNGKATSPAPPDRGINGSSSPRVAPSLTGIRSR